MTSPTTPTTPFGRGLRLDDGDLVLSGARLDEVSGLPNLVQALLVRLGTPLGTDRLTANYGLSVNEALTGPVSRDMAKELLRLSIITTLSADPRVSEVSQVLFDDDPAYLAAHPDAATRRSRRTATVEITVVPTTAPTAAAAPTPTTLLANVSW